MNIRPSLNVGWAKDKIAYIEEHSRKSTMRSAPVSEEICLLDEAACDGLTDR